MLYNLLSSYRGYLEARYSRDTARTYYHRLCALFDGQSITETIKLLDFEKVLFHLAAFKHKNEFSQAKNSFLHFCEFQNVNIPTNTKTAIAKLESETKRKYRKAEKTAYQPIDQKIKHIKNSKLKLSYQVIQATGLRVSELAQITSTDCSVSDDEILFNFLGKGGGNEVVSLKQNEYSTIYTRVIEHIEMAISNDQLFYSAIYLQTKARELGFKCHDLRRAYAKIEYKKSKSKSGVMKKLRHSQWKTTNIYLRSRVDI